MKKYKPKEKKTYFQKELEKDKINRIKYIDSRLSDFKASLLNYLVGTDFFDNITNRDEKKQLQEQRTEINEYIKNEIAKIEIVYNDKHSFKIK